jgi:HD-GYP domain-containing protein (c-di-GMP phosphodiesterase class II)
MFEKFDQTAGAFQGMDIDVGRAAHAVTKALDYVGVDDRSHGRRVGLICHRIAHLLGWERDRRHFALLAGMMHDCGVSSTVVHQKLLNDIEWDGAEHHCERGDYFLRSFPPFSGYAKAVRYHHTRWRNMPDGIDQETREYANLIFLADRLDVIYSRFVHRNSRHEVLLQRAKIIGELEPYADLLFAGHIFEAAKEAIKKDSFWLELRDEYLDDTIFETLSSGDYQVSLSFDEIESLAELISLIVDAKSPFTHYHSLRVADLSYSIGGLAGLSYYQRRILRIAGLLHDVGKLRTPDDILEKPGALSDLELAQMRAHPLDSKRVLKAIFPNTPIAKWASEHHEKLDGSGYPFGWSGDQIDLPTRVLSIADIFQALCQKRPYRDRLEVDEVLTIMDDMEAKGQIDADIYNLLKVNKKELYQTAIREGITDVSR